jgi:hypothetical protein
MRTRLTVGGCITAATAVIACAGFAQAEPPPSMTFTDIAFPVIACDTKDQMMQVVQSIKDGKLRDKLTELEAIKDDRNEPVCVYSPLSTVVFGESEHIGRIEAQGQAVDVWVSNVGNREMGFYVLWGEQIEDAPA